MTQADWIPWDHLAIFSSDLEFRIFGVSKISSQITNEQTSSFGWE